MFSGRFPPGFEADLQVRGLRQVPLLSAWFRPMVSFMYRLRWAEYFSARPGPLAWVLAAWYRFHARRMGMFLGLTVPPGTCGPGLHIMHWGALVISGQARIGRNCRLHMGVNIGASKGAAPRIGDNVYVGPGAKLFGPIEIGDNVVIGANAVVNKSFPANVVIAGIPARIIRYLDPSDTSDGNTQAEVDHDKEPPLC